MSAISVSASFVEQLIDFTEEIGARSPGWFLAECNLCGTSTTGGEPTVEDWAYEHVRDEHARWKVYKQREGGYWSGLWIVQPRGADFEGSYAFRSHRHALQYAVDRAADA